jgi:uncharacterized protein
MGLQVRDIAETRYFYREVVGCAEGASDEEWLDFNLCGQPIVCRLDPQLGRQGRVVTHYDLVGRQYVPIAHCGLVLEMKEWRWLARRLMRQKVRFVVEHYTHSKSAAGEQETLFLVDPSGNVLEVHSSCNNDDERLRYERRRALGKWMRWAALIAFVVCCILLLPKSPV